MTSIERDAYSIIMDSSLLEEDKRNLIFILEYFEKKHDPKLSSRSFLFSGPPGVGKTFIADKIITLLNKETLYVGFSSLNLKNVVKCKSLNEAVKNIDNEKEQVIFLDDLNYIFSKEDYNVSPKDKRSFMRLLETVSRNHNKILITTLNELQDLDESMVDRIDVKIEFDLPSYKHKNDFLDRFYKEQLNNEQIDYLAKNSIGYNYRDLVNVLKLSYRLGDSILLIDSIKRALKIYKPTQLYAYRIENGIDKNLSNVLGNVKKSNAINRLIKFYKNRNLIDGFDIKRLNMILFHGPPGTGKTFMARALAGELGMPLIHVGKTDLDSPRFLKGVFEIAKRYNNCVVFIDEADKLIGNYRFGEDNENLGEFNRFIEGADGRAIKSIFIVAVNDMARFGSSLKDRFVHLKFEMPNYDDRLEFFNMKLNKDLSRTFNLDSLAKLTEDMSFRDLERVYEEIIFSYVENKKLNEDEIVKLVKNDENDEKNLMVG